MRARDALHLPHFAATSEDDMAKKPAAKRAAKKAPAKKAAAKKGSAKKGSRKTPAKPGGGD